MIDWLKHLWSGRPRTDEERAPRRNAHIYVPGAGAGTAMKPGPDGKVRMEEIHANENEKGHEHG